MIQTMSVVMGKPGRHCSILSRTSVRQARGHLMRLWCSLPHLSNACNSHLWRSIYTAVVWQHTHLHRCGWQHAQLWLATCIAVVLTCTAVVSPCTAVAVKMHSSIAQWYSTCLFEHVAQCVSVRQMCTSEADVSE